ncbi:MAG: hypothetical protein WBF33_33330, partial [Candidatus Nitrosopolaris sp.]
SIEEGYEYILDEPNIYLNISYDDGNYRYVEPVDTFGEPLDQEDYKHDIRTIADATYRKNNYSRWKVLLETLSS